MPTNWTEVIPEDIVTNGTFETWTDGTSVAPDGWTIAGAGASIARESTIVKVGTYSARLTRSGTDTYVFYPIPNAAKYGGRTITYGAWVYATVADRARLIIGRNGAISANVYSSYHTGNSTWQFLTATVTLSSDTTGLIVYYIVDTGDTSAYFDRATAKEAQVWTTV